MPGEFIKRLYVFFNAFVHKQLSWSFKTLQAGQVSALYKSKTPIPLAPLPLVAPSDSSKNMALWRVQRQGGKKRSLPGSGPLPSVRCQIPFYSNEPFSASRGKGRGKGSYPNILSKSACTRRFFESSSLDRACICCELVVSSATARSSSVWMIFSAARLTWAAIWPSRRACSSI